MRIWLTININYLPGWEVVFPKKLHFFIKMSSIAEALFPLAFLLTDQQNAARDSLFQKPMNGDDPFADFSEEVTSQPAPKPSFDRGGGRGGSFAEEIFSEKIAARMRTFFIDVKQSSNGKFLKISEKSRGGQKSTIMMDAEDLPAFINALQKAQQAL